MAASTALHRIKTRILILSDTNGMSSLEPKMPKKPIDVVIHCGNLTQHSELEEFENTIRMLSEINAPLKLVIAGNHDWSLDLPVMKRKLDEAKRRASAQGLDVDLVGQEFGSPGEAIELLMQAWDLSIVLLDEGTHRIPLSNGALLNLYASPRTPSNHGKCGFQYSGVHRFRIPHAMDMVVTHGPPRGLMDMTLEKQRIGCPWLFASVAKSQPRVHCFGHVHNGWGAKLVSWRSSLPHAPTLKNAVDEARSTVIESLSTLRRSNIETARQKQEREERLIHMNEWQCRYTSHCKGDQYAVRDGQTLFINASIRGWPGPDHKPWLIDLDLEPHSRLTWK